jgi:hypothetical protein
LSPLSVYFFLAHVLYFSFFPHVHNSLSFLINFLYYFSFSFWCPLFLFILSFAFVYSFVFSYLCCSSSCS